MEWSSLDLVIMHPAWEARSKQRQISSSHPNKNICPLRIVTKV